ncbi:helix-turn-helix transcriptional regulator [Streptomyces shenzhenensis]|uniref:Helix-turn-helix transcriptional regulator n=2 Tax=Streptomyces shenzhenensis TaxID=943815 RepID=A0A3M0I808_9ACTN|nr:helix-turn-helix transcriptional regulator [Streptomyces shenzhenensis]
MPGGRGGGKSVIPAIKSIGPDPDVQLDVHELRLLVLLAEGLGFETVARKLGVSERTVRRRIRVICDRIGVETLIEAVVWAVRAGLV